MKVENKHDEAAAELRAAVAAAREGSRVLPTAFSESAEPNRGVTMQHGRIPWPEPEELDADQRVVYDAIVGGPRGAASAFPLTDDAGRLNGPFNSMLLVPALGEALQEVGAAIRYRSPLSDREREIAILTLAAHRKNEFEWYAHERVGAGIGMSPEELDALANTTPAQSMTVEELTVQSLTGRLVLDRDLSDREFADGLSTLGLEKLSALITLVGYYDLLALGLTAYRTPLPDGEPHRFT